MDAGDTYLLIILLILVFTVTTEIFAGVAGDLGSFFTSLGYEGNITPGTAYEGQAAGYYSGGSVFLRDRVRNIQLIKSTDGKPDFSAKRCLKQSLMNREQIVIQTGKDGSCYLCQTKKQKLEYCL